MMESRDELIFLSDDELRSIKPLRIVFLDIDGVLNGYSNWTWRFCSLVDFLHLRKQFLKVYDIFGVRRHKVRLLSKILKKTGAKVVISSSWRGGFKKGHIDREDSRLCKLKKEFDRFHIEVIGITPKIFDAPYHRQREYEINAFVDMMTKICSIDSFVILDDERADLQPFVGNRLVQTSDTEVIMGKGSENTGLKRKHVRQAIRVLNTKL
jgi:hypothetical protein